MTPALLLGWIGGAGVGFLVGWMSARHSTEPRCQIEGCRSASAAGALSIRCDYHHELARRIRDADAAAALPPLTTEDRARRAAYFASMQQDPAFDFRRK